MVGVPNFRVAPDGSLVDAEQRQFADKGVGGGLEHQRGQRPVGVGGVVRGIAGAGLAQARLGAVRRRGQVGTRHCQKLGHPDIFRGRCRQDRHQFAPQHRAPQSRLDFPGGQFLAAEVAVGQFVIAFGGGFD